MDPDAKKDARNAGWPMVYGLAAIAMLGLVGAACTTAGAQTQPPTGTVLLSHDSLVPGPAAPQPATPPNELCLACHGKAGVETRIGDRARPLEAVAVTQFASSAHGNTPCAKCHQSESAIPHTSASAAPVATEATTETELCSSCHREASEGYSHTVHGIVGNLGDKRAPGCTDCHSTHQVERIGDWRSAERAEACARCHEGAGATFAQAAMGHREASATWFAPTYFAGRFLVLLLASVLAFGTLHVELDMLRWGAARIRGRHNRETRK